MTKEAHARATAQAMLVVIREKIVQQSSDRLNMNYFVNYRNLGERPILEVTLEGTFESPDNTTISARSESEPYALTNTDPGWSSLSFTTEAVNKLKSWRVFWGDSDGFKWEATVIEGEGKVLREVKTTRRL